MMKRTLFRTVVGVVASFLVASLVAVPASANPGTNERVSVASDESQSSGPIGSLTEMSPDGRFVVFNALASDLVAGDTNGFTDTFLRDRQAGTTERVSVASDGSEANAGSGEDPDVSADGRFVAFGSRASNLVAGDTNGTEDIFVHDRQTGITERMSLDVGGAQLTFDANEPSISGDGRFVAFTAQAGGPSFAYRILVRDRLTGVTVNASVSNLGVPGNGPSTSVNLSFDGRYVTFRSFSSNLVPGDGNSTGDIFVRDLLLQTTERVSVASGGAEADSQSFVPYITADGRYIEFSSLASNLVPGDTNGNMDVFVHDRQTQTTERVSLGTGGVQAVGSTTTEGGGISDDGRFSAFHSNAANLVPGDTNGALDVFVYDRQTQTTERISVAGDGTQGNGFSLIGPGLSADGAIIAFRSNSSNLVSGDTNGSFDVFVHDRFGVAPPSDELTALDDAHTWVGLKNSDDQGTRFDVKVELLENGTVVATGMTRCVSGVTRNANQAKEVIVAWDAFGGVTLEPGDVLALRVSTRIGTNANDTKCGPGGHNNAVGLRMYYDSTTRASRFGATITPNPSANEYLHSDGGACTTTESAGVTTRYFDETSPSGTTAKCKDSTSINFNSGNPWAVIGTWSRAPQS